MRTARRLFARALEAKGGLKIHTIHGFCERLLQRFPLESQVTPHFSVLDERDQALLRRAAFDAIVARAAEDSDGILGNALGKIVGLTSGDYIRQVIDAVLGKRAELARMVAYHKSREDWAEAEARRSSGCSAWHDCTEDELTDQLAAVLSDDEIDAASCRLRRVRYGGAGQRRGGWPLRAALSDAGRKPRGGARCRCS